MTKLNKAVLGTVAAVALAANAFATVPAQTNCSYVFNANMRLGAVSPDVMNLQKLLNLDAATRVAATGAGSPGNETMRFGPATFAAVKKFQSANGISPVSGYVGPLTRAVLNTVCTGSSGNSGNSGNVSSNSNIVSNNIPVSVLVAGQSSAKIAEFVVNGNGTVTGLDLMRIGVSNNNTLKNVYLYDGATRLTDGSSASNDGTIKFSSSAGLFTVNGSKTITVKSDINTGTSGQTTGVAMKSIRMMGATSSTPVTGVNGPLFSISTANMTTADFPSGNTTSPAATSINAGSINQNLWSRTLNIGVNPAKLHGVTVKMIGSAPANALANVKLFVDGVDRGSASINAMNQFVFNLSSNPVSLSTGSHVIEVRGDVVGGANRNFYISLEQATDIMVEDTTLPGVFTTVTTNSGLNATNLVGGLVTINNGSLTINQDPAFSNTTTLVGGATNVKLGAWKFTSYGEDVKVNSLTFNPNFSGLTPASTTLANVGLYVNGGQVGSNQTATHATPLTFSSLGSNLRVDAGQTVIVELRGDIMSSGNVAYTAGTVQMNLAAGSSNAQGIQSSQVTSTAASPGQNLTISSSNVVIANTTGFANSIKAPNQSNVKIGSFTVQTGSAEGVTITDINVAIPGGSGTLLGANQITNLTVKDGSTTVGTPKGNPTNSNNFSANISVPQSSTKVLEVYADIGSGPTGHTVTPSMTVTVRGNTSNLVNTVGPAAGAVTTVNTASIANTDITFVPGSSPVAQYVVGPQSNLAIATFNVKTNNNVGGAVIKDVTFTVPANTISSVTVNGKTAAVVGTTATVYDVGIVVPSDNSGINVPVTVALVCATSGAGCAGASGTGVNLIWGATTYNNGSNVVPVSPAPSAGTPGHTLVATKPTITMTSSSVAGGLANGASTLQVGTFTIAADAAGDIKLQQIPVVTSIAGGGAITAGSVELRDSAGSAIITGVTPVNGGAANFVFTTPRTIGKGTSETYTVWMSVTGVSGAAGTQSVSFQLGPKANFQWIDVAGNVTGLSGTPINNYPTGSQSKSN